MTIELDLSGLAPVEIDLSRGHRIDIETIPGRTGPQGPRGPEGPGVGEQLVMTNSHRAILPFRSAVEAGEATIVWTGDSNTEGTGVSTRAERFQNLVRDGSRARWHIDGGDAGVGYRPVRTWTFFGFSDDPTWVGDVTELGAGGGLGNRSASLNAAGASITWPALSCRYITVHYTERVAAYAGTFDVVVDGMPVQTIDTTATGNEGSVTWAYDLGSVAARTVAVEHTSGQPRVEGITFETSLSGITSIDASRSGAKVSDYTAGLPTNDLSDERHWQAVAACQPHLVVAAFGRNDQASYSADDFGQYLAEYRDRVQAAAPGTGLLFVMAPQRVEDVTADPLRIRRFEEAARAAIGGDPLCSILYESSLWAPVEGVDYEQGDPSGFLADTVHASAAGHQLIADMILAELIGTDAATAILNSTLATIGDATAATLNDTSSAAYAALVAKAGQITDPQIASAISDPSSDSNAALAGEADSLTSSAIESGSSTNLAFARRLSWIDPHIEYGAVGDGITDDTNALQLALNAAGESAIRTTVRLRRGATYCIGDEHLSIFHDNVRLDGNGATIKPLPTSTMRAVIITGSHVLITDLTVDMNRSETVDGGSNSNQQGILISAATKSIEDVQLRRCAILNSHQRGISAQASGATTLNDIGIYDSTVADVGDRGIHVGGSDAATNATVNIRNCRVARPAGYGIICQGVSDAHVTGCHVTGDATSLDSGIVMSATNALSTDWSVTGCIVTGFLASTRWGIVATWGATRFRIDGNVVQDCAGGIAVDPERGDMVGVEIDVAGTATGNVVKGTTVLHGISVRLCGAMAVTGNTVQDTYLAGIAVSSATGVSVTGNNLARLGQYGVGLFGTTVGGGHAVGPNVIRDWGQRVAVPGPVYDSGTPIPNAFVATSTTP